MFRERGDTPGKACRGEKYVQIPRVLQAPKAFKNSSGSQTKAMDRAGLESK